MPGVATKLPVAHMVNGWQAVAFAVALNVPAEQGVHCRSAVLEPGDVGEMNWPELQLLQGAQALAGFIS